MEAVTGAMTTLLPKLANLLIGEYNLQKSVRSEILLLKAELERMDAALLQLSEAPIDEPPDRLTKLWQRDVRELSYDVEDSIDRFIVHIQTRDPSKPHSFMAFVDRSRSLLTRAKIRRKIGTSIKEIKIRVKEISERHDRYKNEWSVVAKHVATPINTIRALAPYRKETELIAIEERSNDLVTRLCEGDEPSMQQLKIISIAGFGGVGKTTIANVVYRKLIREFDCGAFVSVSLKPDIAMIFKDMLHMLDKEQYRGIYGQTWGVQQLMGELREHLQDKRYFIVVDDIWSISDWKIIQYALIQNAYGSKIITTTRSLDVAKQIGGVYRLEPLSPIDSRKLFYQRIFGNEDKCPNHLAKLSTDIFRKCAGVPLAIITIASVLTGRNEKENAQNYWSKVYQSMGSGLAESTEVKDMRRILSVSYYDLPPHLKTCLLYFSLFPEDYKISTKKLIWKWIGEGFVNKQHGKTLYELGEIYVEELVNRSMIQAIDIDRESKTVSCSVHDMVFDLICFLSNEEQFLTKLSRQYMMSLPNKVRRLSIKTSQQEDVEQLETMSFSFSHVRSLTVFGLMPTLATFVVLRVLDLSYCKKVKNRHCKNICNMFHLRYLSLRGTYITNIPAEISNLKVLQVLDISENSIQEMPSTIIHLQQLLHLHVDRIRLPDGFGLLKSLQEVEGSVNIDSPSMLDDLGKLTELNGTLTLTFCEWDESYVKPFLQCLSNMVNLKSLYIEGEISSLDSGCDSLSPGPQQLCSIYMPKTCGICAMPRWMSSLCLLSSLCITLLTLREQDLQVLGIIPSLSYLSVIVMQTTQDRVERLVIGNSCPFECLTELDLKCRGSMVVVFAPGAMQNLKTLFLELGAKDTMHQFGDFDVGLEHLTSLELVSVHFDWDDPKEEREAVGGAIREALEKNPNRPTLQLEVIVVLKISLHCEGCAHRIENRIYKLKGVNHVVVYFEKDEVQVTGTMNVPEMLVYLREKLNRNVKLAEPGEKDGSSKGKDKREASAKITGTQELMERNTNKAALAIEINRNVKLAEPGEKDGSSMGKDKREARAKIRGTQEVMEKNTNKPALAVEVIVLLKISLHCEVCADRVKLCIYKLKEVKDVVLYLEKDEVQVTGTMNVPEMLVYLREKLNRNVELAEPGEKDGSSKGKDKREARAMTRGTEEALERNTNKPALALEVIVLLKISLHCEVCADRVKQCIYKLKGVKDVVLRLEMDEVQVRGTMDVPAMITYLREKLKRSVELAEPGEKDGSSKGKDKRNTGMIYEANQTPAAPSTVQPPFPFHIPSAPSSSTTSCSPAARGRFPKSPLAGSERWV